jgi:hypothetical protein
MPSDDKGRRLRAVLRNALMWGLGWSAAAFVVTTTMWLTGNIREASLFEVVGLSIKFGVWGTIAGGVFSGIIGLLYRGRRLSEISWVRFGLGGAVVTGLFVPLFMQVMNVLSGDGMVPWNLVTDDAVITGVFGGLAAAVSLKLAQRADRALRGGGTAGQLEAGEWQGDAMTRSAERRERVE